MAASAKTPPFIHRTLFQELSSQVTWTQFTLDHHQSLTTIFSTLVLLHLLFSWPINTIPSVPPTLHIQLVKILVIFVCINQSSPLHIMESESGWFGPNEWRTGLQTKFQGVRVGTDGTWAARAWPQEGPRWGYPAVPAGPRTPWPPLW